MALRFQDSLSIRGATPASNPPGGNPLVTISFPLQSPPPHPHPQHIPSPLGSNLERMWEVTLLPLLQDDFIFPRNCSSVGWPDAQLEFPNFLCPRLSQASPPCTGASSLHLGSCGAGGGGDLARAPGMLSPGLPVPGSTSQTSPSPVPSSLSLSSPCEASPLARAGPSGCGALGLGTARGLQSGPGSEEGARALN